MTLLPETRRALSHRLATAQVQGRAPSVVATVVRAGRPQWTEGRGSVGGAVPDGDVQYRIGSITKVFVAVLVLRLRDEGLVGLADPLAAHLPDGPAGQATVGALLAHTAGLAADPPGPWWERTDDSVRPGLADLPDGHPPGRRFHYSNPGYALLGALVEQVRGEPWGDVLQREVLEPLGMSRTTLRPVPPHPTGWAVHPWADVLLPEPSADTGRMGPAGQLWSTATDLARFAAFLGEGDEPVLHPDTVAEMRTPASPPEAASWDSGYGLGLQLLRRDGRVLAGHTGSMPGFVATVWVSPEDDVAAVVLANLTAGLPVGALAADLLHTVAEREPRIPPPWQPLTAVDPELLDLAGPWYKGPAPFVLRPLADGVLELTPLSGTARGTRMRPTAGGEWEGLNGYFAGERLRLVRDAAGAVSHLDLGSYIFTRQPYDPAAPVPGGVDPAGWRTHQ
jgi:CubicO group peptidase (beta-lactamase class C family)